MTRRSLIMVAVILTVAAVLILTGPPVGGDDRFVTRTEHIMACPITVQVPAEHADAIDDVFDVFRSVDERMSEWKATSSLSAVNAAAGERAVAVPDDLRSVLRRAIEIGEVTDGAFDVTWAALWGLWDFRAERPRVPDAAEITRRTALVDFRAVEIDDEAGTVRLPEHGMVIGLGAIAKGYALDRSAEALRARDVDDFLISAAGQMMVGGAKSGRPWRIGIRDPRGAADDFFAHVEVTDVSVSTSGDYERAFIVDGVRYHHILDPRTGRPARGVRSATVVAADATLADALSTTLVIMGVERGLALIETLPGVEAVMVDDAARVHASRGLNDRLIVRHSPTP